MPYLASSKSRRDDLPRVSVEEVLLIDIQIMLYPAQIFFPDTNNVDCHLRAIYVALTLKVKMQIFAVKAYGSRAPRQKL